MGTYFCTNPILIQMYKNVSQCGRASYLFQTHPEPETTCNSHSNPSLFHQSPTLCRQCLCHQQNISYLQTSTRYGASVVGVDSIESKSTKMILHVHQVPTGNILSPPHSLKGKRISPVENDSFKFLGMPVRVYSNNIAN